MGRTLGVPVLRYYVPPPTPHSLSEAASHRPPPSNRSPPGPTREPPRAAATPPRARRTAATPPSPGYPHLQAPGPRPGHSRYLSQASPLPRENPGATELGPASGRTPTPCQMQVQNPRALQLGTEALPVPSPPGWNRPTSAQTPTYHSWRRTPQPSADPARRPTCTSHTRGHHSPREPRGTTYPQGAPSCYTRRPAHTRTPHGWAIHAPAKQPHTRGHHFLRTPPRSGPRPGRPGPPRPRCQPTWGQPPGLTRGTARKPREDANPCSSPPAARGGQRTKRILPAPPWPRDAGAHPSTHGQYPLTALRRPNQW